jgi:N-glycosylase/DNA lyase
MKAIERRLAIAVEAVCVEIEERRTQPCIVQRNEQDVRETLIRCLLSSRVPYESAIAAARRLRERGLLRRYEDPDWVAAEEQIRCELSRPFGSPGRAWRYRFPRARAMQVAASLRSISEADIMLASLIWERDDVVALRRELVEQLCGIGPKQGSMFLRDVGRSSELAILDSHVIAYMEIRKLLPTSRAQLSALGRYEKVEQRFRAYAQALGRSIACLDRAVWIVMRVATREGLV